MSTEWRYLDHVDVTAAAGLAVDDCLTELQGLKNQHSAPIIRLYNYEDHCALVGRFQNLEAEVNIPYCESHGYGFSRRKTGGGAIMMGRDQLGICITSNQHDFPWQHISELYSQLSAPIIEALKKLGIEASFRSKNDLEVNGKKNCRLGCLHNPWWRFSISCQPIE